MSKSTTPATTVDTKGAKPVVVEAKPEPKVSEDAKKEGRTAEGLQEQTVTVVPTATPGQPTKDTKVALSAGGPLREPATLGIYTGAAPTNADLQTEARGVRYEGGEVKEMFRAADERDLVASPELKKQHEDNQKLAEDTAKENASKQPEVTPNDGSTVSREDVKKVEPEVKDEKK